MSRIKHTPAPWGFGQALHKKSSDQKEDCLIHHKDSSGLIFHIAETFQYRNDEFKSQDGVSLANAKLIAAAPELLEALKELQFVIKKFGIREPNNLTQCFGAMDKAKRAINKTEETK